MVFKHLLSVPAEECFAASWRHKVTAARCRPPHTPHCQSRPQRWEEPVRLLTCAHSLFWHTSKTVTDKQYAYVCRRALVLVCQVCFMCTSIWEPSAGQSSRTQVCSVWYWSVRTLPSFAPEPQTAVHSWPSASQCTWDNEGRPLFKEL